MFQIVKNTLAYEGMSFQLPEGLYLDMTADERDENCIVFKPKDESFILSVEFLTNREPIYKSLVSYLVQEGAEIYTIARVEMNGLQGFECTYGGEGKSYYEAYLRPALPESQVYCTVCIETEGDIFKDVLKNSIVRTFLDHGIRWDGEA